MGLESIVLDWRWKFRAHVWMDAIAGITIGSRRWLLNIVDSATMLISMTAFGMKCEKADSENMIKSSMNARSRIRLEHE